MATQSSLLRHYQHVLWTQDEITQALDGTWVSGDTQAWQATGVCYYLKQIVSGDLVFTTTTDVWGPKVYNTRQNLAEIFAAGAQAVITDQMPKSLSLPANAPVFLVKNTLQALLDLAAVARQRYQGKVVCVTGTVGKTTIKECLLHVLSQQATTYASNRNFNHRPGVAVSLTQTPADYDYAIYEFSVDAPKRTQPKALLAAPHVAIINEIQPHHLSKYPSLEAIAKQKALLFDGLQEGGVAILNRDNAYFALLHEIATKNPRVERIISFGQHGDANVRLLDYTLTDTHSQVKASINHCEIDYTLGIPGRHNIANSLAVLACVDALGANVPEAANALASMQAVNKRTNRIRLPLGKQSFEIIDDSTNANPASVKAGLAYLKLIQPQTPGRRVAILFEIRELGERSAQYHADLANDVIENHIDKVYAYGEEMQHLFAKLPANCQGFYSKADLSGLISAVVNDLCANDIIMIKGTAKLRKAMNKVIRVLSNLDK
jgi:UDP-N-acetylmuramoyl-tripeptide--D-alanyl-D-alanine ligase